MARLFFSGFELSDASEWTSGSPTVSGSYARTGSFGAHVTSTQGPVFTLANSASPRYLRAWFRIGANPSTDMPLLQLSPYNGTNSTLSLRAVLLSNGTIQMRTVDGISTTRTDGTNVGSPSSAVTASTWFCVEIAAQYGNPSGLAKANLNNTSFCDTTLNYSNASGANVNRAYVGPADIGTDAFDCDDVVVDDAAFPGPGGVYSLIPNGAGAYTNWTRGGTDSGADWSQCEEVPPNDSTDYVTASTQNVEDAFGLPDVGTIPTHTAINTVRTVIRASGDNGTANTISYGMLQTDNTHILVDSVDLKTVNGTWGYFFGTIRAVAPTSGTAWTDADITSLQTYLKKTQSQTGRHPLITAIYLMVDYAESISTAPQISKSESSTVKDQNPQIQLNRILISKSESITVKDQNPTVSFGALAPLTISKSESSTVKDQAPQFKVNIPPTTDHSTVKDQNPTVSASLATPYTINVSDHSTAKDQNPQFKVNIPPVKESSTVKDQNPTVSLTLASPYSISVSDHSTIKDQNPQFKVNIPSLQDHSTVKDQTPTVSVTLATPYTLSVLDHSSVKDQNPTVSVGAVPAAQVNVSDHSTAQDQSPQFKINFSVKDSSTVKDQSPTVFASAALPYSVNVHETLTVKDQSPQFRLNIPTITDHSTVKDQNPAVSVTLATPASITVSEHSTVKDQNPSLSFVTAGAAAITVQEHSTVADAAFGYPAVVRPPEAITVADHATVATGVQAQLTIAVSEHSTVKDQPPTVAAVSFGQIMVSEHSTVADAAFGYPAFVGAPEHSTLHENVTVSLGELALGQIAVSEHSSVGEQVDIQANPDFFGSVDTLTVAETATVALGALVLSVSDHSTVHETLPTVSVPAVGAASISVSDHSTVTDQIPTATLTTATPFQISVSDHSSVKDQDPTVLFKDLVIAKTEAITLHETPPTLSAVSAGQINVADHSTVAEIATVLFRAMVIAKGDIITVKESLPLITGARKVVVSDHSTVKDQSPVFKVKLSTVTPESSTVHETATVVLQAALPRTISVSDHTTVKDQDPTAKLAQVKAVVSDHSTVSDYPTVQFNKLVINAKEHSTVADHATVYSPTAGPEFIMVFDPITVTDADTVIIGLAAAFLIDQTEFIRIADIPVGRENPLPYATMGIPITCGRAFSVNACDFGSMPARDPVWDLHRFIQVGERIHVHAAPFFQPSIAVRETVRVKDYVPFFYPAINVAEHTGVAESFTAGTSAHIIRVSDRLQASARPLFYPYVSLQDVESEHSTVKGIVDIQRNPDFVGPAERVGVTDKVTVHRG